MLNCYRDRAHFLLSVSYIVIPFVLKEVFATDFANADVEGFHKVSDQNYGALPCVKIEPERNCI